MTTKIPADVVVNKGLRLSCSGPCRAVLWVGGLGGWEIDLERNNIKKLAKGLQAILDYEKPSWIPKPGEYWRHKGHDSVFIRDLQDKYEHKEKKGFTSTCIIGPHTGGKSGTKLTCPYLEPVTIQEVKPIDPGLTFSGSMER